MIHKSTYAVAPIGDVNLRNGDNKMHGKVWNCWAENTVAVIVVHEDRRTFRAVVTHISETADIDSVRKNFAVGSVLDFRNDSTGRSIKGIYRVLGVFVHNSVGHLEISKAIGKRSLWFATFK